MTMQKVIHWMFPEYFVWSNGVVERRIDSKKYQKAGSILRGRVLASGYRQYKLVRADGIRSAVRANRLVCEAFHGPPPTDRHHAAHKNGNRLDNRAENLYWATPRQNKRDSINHGTSVRGEETGNARLTNKAVRAIRDGYQGKRGDIARLAREFGVGTSCIYRVVTNQTWSHVPGRSALDRRMGP